ncbi:MAG TPA: class I SAM-dependent methyltransferase [Nitrospiraceae bacterium]|nr:class I SAM-dependent methyltransferase [Nitrospiraceae bacterium]
MSDVPNPKLYRELAVWWPLLSPPEEYVDEAESYRRFIVSANPHAKTLLELGCGGGNNASHLKKHFRMTLVDLSQEMLAVSRKLNPECEHLQGDMRTIRVGRLFDAVFIHDAIAYLLSEDDLRKAIETAFAHCRPGGVALFVPDYVQETFHPRTAHGGHDAGTKGMRYLEWIWDPDPTDTTHVADYAYLLREADGRMRCELDRHLCGLFARSDWLRLISAVGFDARAVQAQPRDVDPCSGLVFLGTKRAD